VGIRVPEILSGVSEIVRNSFGDILGGFRNS